MKGVSLFTGGGLLDMGLRGIVDFVGGVELDAAIAAHATKALGHEVLCASVVDVDYRQWFGVDHLHFSPPCTNASVANANAGETELDILLGSACCRAIREIRPRFVTMENVAGYAGFKAFASILDTLKAEGYTVHWAVYDAASFGVPQHRKRIMLRARRDGKPLPEVLPTHGSPAEVEANRIQPKMFAPDLLPWVGWYEAVADLLPSCPETALAPWQVKRLEAQYGVGWIDNLLVRYAGQDSEIGVPVETPSPSLTADGCGKSRAIIVNGVPMNHAGDIDARQGERDAPPLTASQDKHPMRAVMVGGVSTNHATWIRPWKENEPSPTVAVWGGGSRAILVEGDACGERPHSVLPPPEQRIVPTGSGGGRVHRAVLVDGENAGEVEQIEAELPAGTIATVHGAGAYRAAYGSPVRVVALTPRCLARFQSLPDDYLLPEKKSLATKIIGNGIACRAARAIFGPMLQEVKQ